jgi:hypothetical protein
VLGFRDETWWTRPAQPDLFAWAGADPLRLGANARDPKGGGPEALACYGVLRLDTGGMMLRFCDGRPVSATTEDFLAWVCGELAAEGKRVFVLVWDNAAWHVSQRVRRWIARHNRRVPDPGVRAAGQGPVAEPDRAEVGARQAGGSRGGPEAHPGRAAAAGVRLLRLPT